jgi:hypothetical protein
MKYKQPFYFWYIQLLYSISQKQNKSLTKFIYNLNSKGLTYGGIEYLRDFGLSPSLNTFKRYTDTLYKTIKINIHQKINSGNCVLWIDNYSKFFRQSNLTNGGFKSCKWTAMGILYCESLNFKKTSNLYLIPPKPLIHFDQNLLIQMIPGAFSKNYDIYIKRTNHFTIPISVNKDDRSKNQINYQFFPFKIIDLDISSNDALSTIIKNYYKKYYQQLKYNLLLCDSNIFWRLCKKYYSKPKPYGSRPIPILGWWHPGKMLVEIVWRKYLSIFIGPLYHFIFPKNNILYKVRLSHSLEFFMYLYKAWEIFENEENLLIDGSKTKKYTLLIKNLKLLFDCLLPLVNFPLILKFLFIQFRYLIILLLLNKTI